VRLENAGGLVHDQGFAASQLLRVRQRRIPLTVAVDKIAASGGYMMACVADQILAAPFAVVGSIGVIAQVPNVTGCSTVTASTSSCSRVGSSSAR
jgi:serine protease SohB